MWVKDGYEKIVIQIVYNIYKTQLVDTEIIIIIILYEIYVNP